MARYKADIYFDEVYVKTVFVEADSSYEADEKLAELFANSIDYDTEALDADD